MFHNMEAPILLVSVSSLPVAGLEEASGHVRKPQVRKNHE